LTIKKPESIIFIVKNQSAKLRAWVVTANMGLGHLRAAHPLLPIAEDGLLTVGYDADTTKKEAKMWKRLQSGYEFLSRVRMLPLIGKTLFKILDTLLYIPPLYPIRDLSNPSFQVSLVKSFIRRGLCSAMLEKIKKNPLPMVTSFYAPAIAADEAGYSRIYCIITDTDANRAWVSSNPRQSRINYFVPCGSVLRRMRSYGIPDSRLFLTGFPLPLELTGHDNLDVLKYDAARRLKILDPGKRFWPLHGRSVFHFLGKSNCAAKISRKFTITFAVGGAGAQTDTAEKLLLSLAERLKKNEIILNLVAGIRKNVFDHFINLKNQIAPNGAVNIIYGKTHDEYFRAFNGILHFTDVLWTKPSELCFYCGLGLPIIMTEPIGSQEDYNRRWLQEMQAGIDQYDPRYTAEWLFDLLYEGRLATAAWEGFLKARKFGTYKIFEVLRTGTMQREFSPLKR